MIAATRPARTRSLRAGWALALAVLLAGCASTGGAADAIPIAAPSGAYRIYDVQNGRFIDLDVLAEAVGAVDVVLFGELHDDSVAHGVQAALFERVSRGRDGVLGMEMFERDVQTVIDRHLAEEIEAGEFLREARAWPNYETDYRPMVEIARERGWAVVGTNLPQRHASAIARGGLPALDALGSAERQWVAALIECPEDGYWTRFLEAMFEEADSAANAAAHTIDEEILRRTYQAQCARDETMAETIVSRLGDGPVFHINGSFHTDYRLGIVPRILRRAPGATIRVISGVPVDDLSAPDLEEHRERADYVVFTAE